MIKPDFMKKLMPWISRQSAAIGAKGKAVWRVLTLSPADDAVSRKRSLGISIERGSLCVAEGRRFLSRVKIGAQKRYPLEENKFAEPGQVAETAFIALRELKAGDAEVQLGIPKEWAIFKSVELPAAVKENLPNVISYELDRLTPFASDEALYDFAVLEESPDKLQVALAAAKAQAINPYLKALREKGISVSSVYLNLGGLAALLAAAGKGRNDALLAIDENGYEFTPIRNGFISSAIAGRLGADSDEAVIAQALQEAVSLCMQQENGERPQRIFAVLAGRLADRAYPVLDNLLKTSLSAGPVPCEILASTGLKPGTAKGKTGPSCAAAGIVLASLRPGQPGPQAAILDLLSRGRRAESGKSYALTAALALIALLSWGFFMVSPVQTEQRILDEMNAQIAAKKAEAERSEALKKEIEKTSRDIGFINGIKLERPSALDILKELTAVLPKTVWLAGVKVLDSNVEIQGYASGSTSDLLPLLENSKLFQKVEFASPTVRNTRMNADNFIIKMELTGGRNGKGKPEPQKKI